MAIRSYEGGGVSITGAADINLFGALSGRSRLHLELNDHWIPTMGRQAKKMLGLGRQTPRETVYREWCRSYGLDPACRDASHDHGPRTTFQVRYGETVEIMTADEILEREQELQQKGALIR